MQVQFRAEKKPSGVLSHFQDLVSVVSKQPVSIPVGSAHAPVSAVLITYNEEAIIGETLSRLWWCDEIVIIDSGSSDKTVEICRENGCDVYTRKFTGFGEQKRFGVSKAKNNWILCLDADEVLTDPLIDEIRNELSQPLLSFDAFTMPRNLVFMNRIFRHGKESGSSIIRLFNRTRGNWTNEVVHEKVEVTGAVKALSGKILHYSYHDYSQFLSKINLYSSLGARKMADRNRSKNKIVVALALPFNFFRYYIIDRNFMNGYRGFAWAVLNTCYHFLKYLKLDEIKQKQAAGKSL